MFKSFDLENPVPVADRQQQEEQSGALPGLGKVRVAHTAGIGDVQEVLKHLKTDYRMSKKMRRVGGASSMAITAALIGGAELNQATHGERAKAREGAHDNSIEL